MTAYLGHLECPRCTARVEEAAFMYGCPACAAEGVPVNPYPAYALEPGPLPRRDGEPGIFRWRDLLPLPAGAEAVSLGEGGTPLVPLPRTGTVLGLQRLLLKDETRNPTWSYKDRLAAVAVTKAAAGGADTVVVSTTGNHGAAAAAYAARAGLRCVALTLASVPLTMKVLMQSYGAQVVALDNPPDRWRLMRAAVEEWGWVPLSGLLSPPIGSNPFGVDSYKTVAYEIFEDLRRAPDAVIVPIAYGDGLAGIHRGFADLVALGLIEAVPRMIAAEPLGPFTATLESGDDVPATVEARPSVAFSTAGSVATFQGVDTIRRSGGEAVIVGDDEETMAAQAALAATEGIYLEASAVTAIVAAGKATLDPGDLVVAIATSTGLKDITATAARLPEVEIIDPTLEALEKALA